MENTNKIIWTKENLRKFLDRSNLAVERALIVLYNNQEADEQVNESTDHNNGKGFTGTDAKLFTRYARQVLFPSISPRTGETYPEGQRLSPRQLKVLREKNPKTGVSRIGLYAGQLLKAAKNNGHKVSLKKAA